MQDHHVSRIRRFNRLIATRIGALDTDYLGRGRPLAQARLLFEIGDEGCDLRALRRRLRLDSGYISRLLASLRKQGLISVVVDHDDKRRRLITLTPAGRTERAAYDALSDGLAQSMLAPLSDGKRERLVEAMSDVEKLLAVSALSINLVSADSADARMCLDAYYAELMRRFTGGFAVEAGQAPAPLAFFVARLEAEPVGCAGLYRLSADCVELKRMWVSPTARGLGIARRLLETLEDAAKSRGAGRIRLDTNRALDEAQKLYRNVGYREIARYNDNPYADFWFEKILSTTAPG